MLLGSKPSAGSPRAGFCAGLPTVTEGRRTHTSRSRGPARWVGAWPQCPARGRGNTCQEVCGETHCSAWGDPVKPQLLPGFSLQGKALLCLKLTRVPHALTAPDENRARTDTAEVGAYDFPGTDAALPHALPHGQLQVEQRHPLCDQHDEIGDQEASCRENPRDGTEEMGSRITPSPLGVTSHR